MVAFKRAATPSSQNPMRERGKKKLTHGTKSNAECSFVFIIVKCSVVVKRAGTFIKIGLLRSVSPSFVIVEDSCSPSPNDFT